MGRCAAGWGSGWGYLRVGDEARAKGRGGTRDRTERAHAQSRTITHLRQTPRHGGYRSPKTTSATRPPVHFLRCPRRVRRGGSRRARQGTWLFLLVHGWYVAGPDRQSRGARGHWPQLIGRQQLVSFNDDALNVRAENAERGEDAELRHARPGPRRARSPLLAAVNNADE